MTSSAAVGRQTLYRGIRMRSRLEADFAMRYLDDPLAVTVPWEYEPLCFAGRLRDGEPGQYLPDFRSDVGSYHIYYEVKPRSTDAATWADVASHMEIVWQAESDAALVGIAWTFGSPVPCMPVWGTQRAGWASADPPIVAALQSVGLPCRLLGRNPKDD